MLCNSVGIGGVNVTSKNITEVYGSMFLMLQGYGWMYIFQKKSVINVTLEWLVTSYKLFALHIK